MELGSGPETQMPWPHGTELLLACIGGSRTDNQCELLRGSGHKVDEIAIEGFLAVRNQ
jgi:hypothetical protein